MEFKVESADFEEDTKKFRFEGVVIATDKEIELLGDKVWKGEVHISLDGRIPYVEEDEEEDDKVPAQGDFIGLIEDMTKNIIVKYKKIGDYEQVRLTNGEKVDCSKGDFLVWHSEGTQEVLSAQAFKETIEAQGGNVDTEQ